MKKFLFLLLCVFSITVYGQYDTDLRTGFPDLPLVEFGETVETPLGATYYLREEADGTIELYYLDALAVESCLTCNKTSSFKDTATGNANILTTTDVYREGKVGLNEPNPEEQLDILGSFKQQYTYANGEIVRTTFGGENVFTEDGFTPGLLKTWLLDFRADPNIFTGMRSYTYGGDINAVNPTAGTLSQGSGIADLLNTKYARSNIWASSVNSDIENEFIYAIQVRHSDGNEIVNQFYNKGVSTGFNQEATGIVRTTGINETSLLTYTPHSLIWSDLIKLDSYGQGTYVENYTHTDNLVDTGTASTIIGSPTYSLGVDVGGNVMEIPITNDLPPSGTAGQVLAKVDGTDYNVEWITAATGGGSETDPDPQTNLAGTAIVGDVVYDTTDNELQVFDGTNFVNPAESEAQATQTANVAAGSTLGLEQILLTNDGQAGKTVLAVAYTTTGKVCGCSLGAGNLVTIYENGADFTNSVPVFDKPSFQAIGYTQPEVMNFGEYMCFTGLSSGAIITSTEGFYGFSEQVDGADESPMPLLSYGLSFKETFFFAFRNSQTYDPSGTSANQGWIHVVNGSLASTIKLTDGSGVTVQGQENIELDPWEYYRLYTEGNEEYILSGTNPMMAAIAANMDSSPYGRFYDSRHIMPLSNDIVTHPRSGFISALYPNTQAEFFVRDGARGFINSTAGTGISPGSPIDFDAAIGVGTGANDADYEPPGATRVRASGVVVAYSGADSAGLEATAALPASAMSQVVAQPLFIDDTGDGGDSGVSIIGQGVGTAYVYSYNTTTEGLDLEYTVPLNRTGVTVTDIEDQWHPTAGLVANETANGSVTLVGDLDPGVIISDVPIHVVVQNGTPTYTPTVRSQGGNTTTYLVSQDDETVTLGITPPDRKIDLIIGSDNIKYKRVINAGVESWTEY